MFIFLPELFEFGFRYFSDSIHSCSFHVTDFSETLAVNDALFDHAPSMISLLKACGTFNQKSVSAFSLLFTLQQASLYPFLAVADIVSVAAEISRELLQEATYMQATICSCRAKRRKHQGCDLTFLHICFN